MKRIAEFLGDWKEPERSRVKPPEWKPMKLKKPTREYCKTELWARLGLKRNAPNDYSDPKGVVLKRVIDTLHDVAESEGHVNRILETCEQQEYFPDGYTIRQVAGAHKATEQRANPNCEKCGGVGFEIVTRSDGYTAVRCDSNYVPIRCECWRVVERTEISGKC